ncbi:MAG: FtsH protease activity modulator HflK [Candidatus Omnitrophota bacterium]
MEFESKSPDEVFNNLKRQFNSSRFKSFPLPIIFAAVLIVLMAITSFYTIQTNEVGVVLRLGKFITITNPGLHFKLPLGIDKISPVKVEYVYKEEFGFRTQTAGIKTVYSQKAYDEESIMLTGDLNVLDLEWIVQFRINDPFSALFKIRDLRKTLRDISESTMREIVGDYTFNEILTTKRIEINTIIQEKLQKILNQYDTGIQIVTVKLQDVNPPDPVKSAFNEVNQAKQEKEKLINQAWEVYNQKIPQAKGEALKTIKEAEGYSLEKVNKAEGDAKRFLLLREEYILAKDVTLRRLYLDYMNDVLKNAGKKYIIDPKQNNILPLLKLENEQ